MEAVDQLRPRHPENDRLGTGDADHALQFLLDVGGAPLEILDRRFDPLGIFQQRVANSVRR